jgi:hypothetical protein
MEVASEIPARTQRLQFRCRAGFATEHRARSERSAHNDGSTKPADELREPDTAIKQAVRDSTVIAVRTYSKSNTPRMRAPRS